jgi:hypothetical protein
MDYSLKFSKPFFKFRPGFNTTCRLGLKHYFDLGDEERFTKIILTDGNFYIYSKLISVITKRFQDLSSVEIASNHIARDRRNLIKALKDCYGDEFNTGSEITIIGFDITEKYDFI